MNSEIRNIVDYLLLKSSYMPNIGLFHGKMCIAIAMFAYANRFNDKLMEEYSADNNRDGFGFTYGDTVEEFEKAAFELGENKVSGVVKTIYGYHIIKRLPLPEMDPEISYNVYVAMAYKAANEYLDTVVENCEITENFYIEELIEMLETE